MKNSCLVAVPHLMALLTPVAQQQVNSLKLFFPQGMVEKISWCHWRSILQELQQVSGQSRKATEFSWVALINPAGRKGLQEVPSLKTAVEMFDLANVRGPTFREIFPFLRESSLFLLGGEKLHWKQYTFSATTVWPASLGNEC